MPHLHHFVQIPAIYMGTGGSRIYPGISVQMYINTILSRTQTRIYPACWLSGGGIYDCCLQILSFAQVF